MRQQYVQFQSHYLVLTAEIQVWERHIYSYMGARTVTCKHSSTDDEARKTICSDAS